MPDYGRYCPVAIASEVIADRWTPLILRELVLGNVRFNDIARGMPGISRSLLVSRLRHLERKGVVETWPSASGKGHEYHLTPAGKDLEQIIESLGKWAVTWFLDEIHIHEIDPVTLMWWMHRRIRPDRFPPHRTVVEFRHTAPKQQTIWLVLERGDASICTSHPGFDVDLVVTATTPALSEVFNGYTHWAHAVDASAIVVEGPPRLVKALPTWFLWSPFAEPIREQRARAQE
jgi:DNA-binding HxlR family transcriptional regulator